jgi:hypothetical protein
LVAWWEESIKYTIYYYYTTYYKIVEYLEISMGRFRPELPPFGYALVKHIVIIFKKLTPNNYIMNRVLHHIP